MALLRLAASAGQELLAVTVDHGLRSEARAEAARVAEWCAAAGIEHRVLAWEGAKPLTGVQAAARAARYRLLVMLAERERFAAILTGHTADDQAETVFMRLARGSGVAGLAGMEAESLIAAGAGEPVKLLRPLLETPRARLMATLQTFGQAWIDDPSNDDPAFERIRTRALLAALTEQNLLTRDALLRTAARARTAAKRIEAADAAWFASHGGRFDPQGWAVLEPWKDAPSSLIARLIRAAGGADYPPADEDAAAALAHAEITGAATLGGAMMKRHGGRLFIFREPAALLGRACVAPIEPARIEPGSRVLWDNRFIIANDGGDAATVIPLGEKADIARLAAEAGAPAEALRAAPWIGSATTEGIADARARCLLEERFFASVMRFP